ncbi:MAG: SDR family NAD(P)-dependent oxidoreductase [Pseudomonadota bacterium]
MTNWMKPGNNAVITGGASGIGLAAASRYVAAGMNVLIADANEEKLDAAAAALASDGPGSVHTRVCDVAEFEQIVALRDAAARELGDVHCLMSNAGAAFPPAEPWENLDTWRRQVEVNLWGIVNACQAFVPAMLDAGGPAAVINTGSKQGITNPPGNYAYNLSKAGVKSYTESLAHALRQIDGCQVSAHLLIPGFTYTGMIARFVPEKPAGAWSAEEVVDFMVSSLERGDFYILCPDNDTPRELDEKRIQWNTDDILKNRSALSRWDPAYHEAFTRFVEDAQ